MLFASLISIFAISVAVSQPSCNLNVNSADYYFGSVPVICVDLYLDPNPGGQIPGLPGSSGQALLNSSVISSRINSSGAGCTNFTFYYAGTGTDADPDYAPSSATFSSTLPSSSSVYFDCDSIPSNGFNNSSGLSEPIPCGFGLGINQYYWYYVTIGDGPGPNQESSPALLAVIVHDITPPIVVCPSDKVITAVCTGDALPGAQTVTLQVPAAQDNCYTSLVTAEYSVDGGSTFTSIVGSLPRTLNLSFNLGTTNVIYRYTDIHNNSTQCSFNVSVNAQSPVAQCLGNIYSTIDNVNGESVIMASMLNQGSYDPCTSPDNLIYLISRTEAFSSLTYTPSITFGCNDQFNTPIPVYFRAVADANANGVYDAGERVSNRCITYLTLHDSWGPTLMCGPNSIISCENAASIPTASWTSLDAPMIMDNCPGKITKNAPVDLIEEGTIIGSNCYTILRTWSVTDQNNGLTASCQQRIEVQDLIQPVFNSFSNQYIFCGDAIPAFRPTASDNCDNLPNIALIDSTSNQTPIAGSYNFYNFTVTRKFRAVDNCGNYKETSQYVFVRDTISPVFNNIAWEVSNDNDADLSDDQSGSLTVTKTSDNSHLTYPTPRDIDVYSADNTIQVRPVNISGACSPQVTLRLPIRDCADNTDLYTTYVIYDADNSIVSSGLYDGTSITTPELFMGETYKVAIYSRDPSLNVSTLEFNISVISLNPIAACDQVTLTLNSSGQGSINAWDVDEGSHTYCGYTCYPTVFPYSYPNILSCRGLSNMWIERLDNHVSTGLPTEYLSFNCADAGRRIPVRLHVEDDFGSNYCDSYVDVVSNGSTAALTVSAPALTNATSGSNGSASTTASGGSGSYTYTISPTGATNSTGSFTGLAAGSYTITARDNSLTDGCTGQALTTTVSFTIASSSSTSADCSCTLPAGACIACASSATLKYTIGDVCATTGIITIPVKVTNFNAAGFQLEIKLNDASVGSFLNDVAQTGVLPGSYSFSLTPAGTIRVSWFTNLTTNTTLADNTTIFNIKLNVTGTLGSSSYISIVNTADFTSETYTLPGVATIPFCTGCSCVKIGSTTAGSFTLGGRIQKFSATGVIQDVSNTTVNYTGGTAYTTTTNATGNYNDVSVPGGANVVVAPYNNSNWTNGVSTLDLILIQQHILGTTLLSSPYKVIAADANLSNSVTTADLVALQQLILGNTSSVAAMGGGTNTSWRFVPQSYTFATPLAPWGYPQTLSYSNLSANIGNANFYAIKVGDVNENASPSSLTSISNNRSNDKLLLNINDVKVEKGSIVEIPVTASNFNDVMGYQFTMEFNPNKLNFVDIKSGALEMNNANLGTLHSGEGLVAMNWYNNESQTIKENEVLFTLVFNVLESSKLSESLNTSSRLTTAESYLKNGVTNGVSFGFTTEKSLVNGLILNQNIPNPFSDFTVISFQLPYSSEGQLRIMDANGRTVKTVSGTFQKGTNELKINKSDLGATGIYYYQISTQEFSSTKKMFLID
ncbi:MAG: T9SS type A sorting domain-containing protein [Saprospiraceae bacterium]|nr:T9SS type A sorting domain-containing protein [Saprospiraceae bacterium]